MHICSHLLGTHTHTHTHTRLQTWRCFVSCNLTAFGQNNKPGQQRSPTEHNKLSIPGATDTKSQARQCATAHYKREASDRELPYHTPSTVQWRRGGASAKVCCIFLQHKINRNSSKFCRLVSGWVWNASHTQTHTHSRLDRQSIYVWVSEYEYECVSVFESTRYCAIIKWNLFLNNYLWQGFCASGSIWATRKASTRLASPNGQAFLKRGKGSGGLLSVHFVCNHDVFSITPCTLVWAIW